MLSEKMESLKNYLEDEKNFMELVDLIEDIDETIFHPYCKTVFKGEKNEKIYKIMEEMKNKNKTYSSEEIAEI